MESHHLKNQLANPPYHDSLAFLYSLSLSLSNEFENFRQDTVWSCENETFEREKTKHGEFRKKSKLWTQVFVKECPHTHICEMMRFFYVLFTLLLLSLSSQCNGGHYDHSVEKIQGKKRRRFLRFLEMKETSTPSSSEQDKRIDDTLSRIQISLEKLADDSLSSSGHNADHPCGCCPMMMMMPCACCSSPPSSNGGGSSNDSTVLPTPIPTPKPIPEPTPKPDPPNPTPPTPIPEQFCTLPKRTYEDGGASVEEVPVCGDIKEKLRENEECVPTCDEGYVPEDETPFVCVRGKESAKNALQPPPLKLALTTKRDKFLDTFTCVKKTCDAVEQSLDLEGCEEQLKYGDECEMKCKDEKKIMVPESYTVRCEKSGLVYSSEEVARCEKKPCEAVEDVTSYGDEDEEKRMFCEDPDQECVLKCKPGWKLPSKLEGKRVCGEDSTW